jgi:hypothetical protein
MEGPESGPIDPDSNPRVNQKIESRSEKILLIRHTKSLLKKTRFDGTFVNTNDLCRGMDSRKKVVCGVAATVIIWLVSLF